jgi:hypothetical protein
VASEILPVACHNHCLQQKSLARIARLIAALFLAKSAGSDWLSGAFLTFGSP